MNQGYLDFLSHEIKAIQESGLYKHERILTSPQNTSIQTNAKEVINLSSNNYLGLANHPTLIEAACLALKQYGYGMASVRFICGTQQIHVDLEQKISQFLNVDDAILYSSCFDANTGLFEALLGDQDAIISDNLNHASIIDGIRLCKAKRFRYPNNNMDALEACLVQAKTCRYKLIATDGVFSMDGKFANLKTLCDLAEQYQALVMVDDSHALGFIGNTGRGTPEYCQVMGRVDILTGTFGKALGGASGGYTAGRKEIITYLRQRSRPYLFSNTLAPMVVATTLKVFELLSTNNTLQKQLQENARFFRSKLKALGFSLVQGTHPIIPILLFDAKLAVKMANALLQEDIYVIPFAYPVVPENQARIRIQISAAHTQEQLNKALHAFEKVGKQLRILNECLR